MPKTFDDVRFRRAHIAFTKALRFSISGDEFHKRIKDKVDAWYRWQGTAKPVLEGRKGHCRDLLQEFVTVENFYLNKELFTLRHAMISRHVFRPNYRLRIVTPSQTVLFDGEIDVVLSIYSRLRVATIALVMYLADVGVDDLIFLKGLKWHSTESFAFNRFFEITSKKNGQKEVTSLEGLVEKIWSDVAPGVVVDFETDSWLDAIEVQGRSRPLSDVELFGLITGDEGYRLILGPERNITDFIYVKGVLDNPDLWMQTRSYFTYNFSSTSVLGRMVDSYPSDKKAFAREYAARYGQIEPLGEYLALDTRIPTLADGIYFCCEIVLIRYLLYQQLDEKVQETLSAAAKRAPSLPSMLELKREVGSSLLDLELVTRDFHWFQVMRFAGKMFGVEILKDHVRDRVEVLERYILAAYNRSINTWMIILAIATTILAFLTLILAFHTVIGLSRLASIWDWVLSFWR